MTEAVAPSTIRYDAAFVPAPRTPVTVPQLPVPAARTWPPVSVVMPVLDEERHLAESVDKVLAQRYPGVVELVLALGPSRDDTDRVARELAASDPRVKLVRNPAGKTPTGLNIAVTAASHDVIARVDGHGVLLPNYLERAVALLEATGAANVGGLMLAVGRTGFEQAVARAYNSPVGLGGGRFHVGGMSGPAESVYLGVFRRDVLERLGGFNEHYHRAQDWELNHRIRQAGELVWFSPELGVTYRPRSSWAELVRQFHATGRWRREVIRHYPGTVSPRYLAPPLAVAGILLGGLAGAIGLATGVGSLALGWLLPLLYGAGVAAASVVEGRGMPWSARVRLPAVLATIHLSWGSGFLVGHRARRGRRARGGR